MQGIEVSMWIYNIIGAIVFIWLSEHFYIEKKGTEERYSMDESIRSMLIGSIIAITWIIAIPVLIELKKRGDDEE